MVPLVVVSLLSVGCPGEVPPTGTPAPSPGPVAAAPAPTPATTTAPAPAPTTTPQASLPLVRYYALPG